MPSRLLTVLLSGGIAVAMFGAAPPPVQAATFTDIADSPFRADIEWLAAEGITSGCGDGRFCPHGAVTRGQMASFLVRMFGYRSQPATDPFRDDNSNIHEANINRVYAAGITVGCASDRICPDGAVTRGQMATFLARALGLRYGAGSDHFADDDGSKHETNLDRLFFAGITRRCASSTDRVCPNGTVTREQMAAFLHRSTYAQPIGPAGVVQVVIQPLTVTFAGPARFRGATFSADGTHATRRATLGTITSQTVTADQTALVNGLRYAHLTSGPMAGTWVKVRSDLTSAVGRAPAPPRCTYQDILTGRRGYDQFATTLMDTIYKLPSSYAPGDLVSTSIAALNSGYSVRSIIAADLRAMAMSARDAGRPIQVVSAYRSYAQQAATFDYWVSVGGYEHALLTSARAGHSEHQLGTTLDFTSLGGAAPWTYSDWARTPAGGWMAANAWRHGFVMTYPRGETATSCYSYEPWHYRYVGKPTAAAVRDSGMNLREAIWAAHGP